ncbi:MAG: nucleotide exchange factor GrpE [Spirochaetes bacterium]|nr:MAG: nucleotide exchange factor GrpE [Spirochaetota bacterium]
MDIKDNRAEANKADAADIQTEEKYKSSKSSRSEGKSKGKASKHKSIKAELLDSLTEEEIKELIVAKETLAETKKLLEEKDVLIKEYEDLLKRQQAEFENYRKRINREIEENKKYANVEVILDIINVLDDFERAIDAARSSKDFNALLEGIVMIEKQLRGILEKKYGVKRIEAVGKEFDPSIHDAIMMEESDEVDEDTVVEDFQKGYIMYDRVIRPSKVKVAKATGPSPKPDFNLEGIKDINEKRVDDATSSENIDNNDENISEKGE